MNGDSGQRKRVWFALASAHGRSLGSKSRMRAWVVTTNFYSTSTSLAMGLCLIDPASNPFRTEDLSYSKMYFHMSSSVKPSFQRRMWKLSLLLAMSLLFEKPRCIYTHVPCVYITYNTIFWFWIFVCTVECSLLLDVQAAPYVPIAGMCLNCRINGLHLVCGIKQAN